MQLDIRYKDVTFETLNREDFLDAIKEAFPHVDWEKAYKEHRLFGRADADREPARLARLSGRGRCAAGRGLPPPSPRKYWSRRASPNG
jgi:hypothetical protein